MCPIPSWQCCPFFWCQPMQLWGLSFILSVIQRDYQTFCIPRGPLENERCPLFSCDRLLHYCSMQAPLKSTFFQPRRRLCDTHPFLPLLTHVVGLETQIQSGSIRDLCHNKSLPVMGISLLCWVCKLMRLVLTDIRGTMYCTEVTEETWPYETEWPVPTWGWQRVKVTLILHGHWW
jgi:hypothetical protein